MRESSSVGELRQLQLSSVYELPVCLRQLPLPPPRLPSVQLTSEVKVTCVKLHALDVRALQHGGFQVLAVGGRKSPGQVVLFQAQLVTVLQAIPL